MVKVSTIYKGIIILCVCIMMGLHLMTPTELIGGNTVKWIVGIIGIILALCSYIHIRHLNKFSKYIKLTTRYIVLFSIAVLISAMYTWFKYNYSLSELLISITPYTYVFFAIPLVYIFIVDGEPYTFLNKIVLVVIIFLCLKSLAWFLYNFQGMTIFPRWIFEYGDEWIRYGLLRVNVGYLNGITILICTYYGFKRQGNKVYIILLLGMILFLNYITRMRFLLAVSFVSMLVFLYYSVEKRKLYIIRRIAIIMVVIFVLTSDFFLQFITSFSLSGELSWSTAARFITINHYWEIIKNNNLFLGVGLLITDNPNSLFLLGTGLRYFLEDIGILGGVFRFGILSVFIYGSLFYYAIKTCHLARRKKDADNWPFSISLCIYMILSCVLLNIFDLQRAFDVPFYLSFFSFVYGEQLQSTQLKK